MIKTWYGPGISIKEKLKRTTSAFLSSTYRVCFWPLEMHRKKFICETKYLTSLGKERVQARLELLQIITLIKTFSGWSRRTQAS